MMDQELLSSHDIELEDGELSNSSDNVYNPLQRPATLPSAIPVQAYVTPIVASSCSPLATCHQMQAALEEDEDTSQPESDESESSSGESSDSCIKKLAPNNAKKVNCQRKRHKRVRRTVMVRVQPTEVEEQKRSKFKKYNIWTATLQEDALTENMRGCDVTQNRGNDRNVENYDYSLRYRLNGENSLKRRLSSSTNDLSDSDQHPMKKRGRPSSRNSREGTRRHLVKSRLGHRSRGSGSRGSSPTSSSENSYEPRHLLDVDDTAGRDPKDIAREISNKLYEKKDGLLVRVVEVLGTELPIELFKETQRIEADGGMMIKNGQRRRTPGGVFLFLLKHHDRVTAEEQKLIFAEERNYSNKWRKEMKSKSRDRKVEELKKRLSKQDKELSALSSRKDHLPSTSDIGAESQGASLSNPPPSPVGQDHSPEYKAHAINHVTNDVSPVKPSTSATALGAATLTLPTNDLLCYDDDFLEVNCGDMDLF